MKSMQLSLKLENSLEYSNNKLRVKRSLKSGNTLEIRDNGLYAPAPKGDPGTPSTGYPDHFRSANGIVSGVYGPYETINVPHRLVGPSTIHKVYYCPEIKEDIPVINLRMCDFIYPGDFFRMHDTVNHNWNYYIILSVTNDGRAVSKYSGIVAIIPDSQTDVN